MKRRLSGLLLALSVGTALAADVGVSIGVGDPNFYGQINIGNAPRPQVIYQEPVVIRHAPTYYPPIYLRVPPGHAQYWGRYCDRYMACGRPVYFVRDDWYRDVYAPRYRHDGRRDDWDDGQWRGSRWDHGRWHGHHRHERDD
ncbi:hypothetical protein HQ393_14490 [Chitinibacter bivalviorum]|uniref:Uncharacterized protein n=1 Tax=Chitinibacter bivalviorum TaxID=2739434 RepID=A0A7H9BKZ7_9NEIS|nr:hypothetical protein [Chitinibacter bivalviorum]QLG89355.1 hypothetical protein HQ393_14490 [Chitinibacter bivalviorum]